MLKNVATTSIEEWIEAARQHVESFAPGLVEIFDIYANEALFGHNFIASDIAKLQQGATILEVGAGSLLLSCHLASKGFNMIALEPTGAGFSHFDRLRNLILEKAKIRGHTPCLIEQPAESLSENNLFDFAFSINVMEHVQDVRLVLKAVCNGLKPGAVYHFTCPNYFFPYEPHFNIPTFFTKHWTEKIWKKVIFNNLKLSDPIGTWNSLNWITTRIINKSSDDIPECLVRFNRFLLVNMLERVTTDKAFADRRSSGIRKLITLMVQCRLHTLFGFFPAMLQPVIDCSILKTSTPEFK